MLVRSTEKLSELVRPVDGEHGVFVSEDVMSNPLWKVDGFSRAQALIDFLLWGDGSQEGEYAKMWGWSLERAEGFFKELVGLGLVTLECGADDLASAGGVPE